MNYMAPQRLPVIEPQDPGAFLWLPDLLAFFRRRWTDVALVLAAVLGLAVVYLIVATPKFAAVTELVIDPQNSDPFKQIPITVGDSSGASAFVDSQIEILQSHGLAERVVQRLKLADDPVFFSYGDSLMGTVLGMVDRLLPSNDAPYSANKKIESATQLLLKLYDVRRVGLSYVLQVDVKTPSADYSAKLANALADEYLVNQVDAKRATAAQAEDWLKQGISQVRERALQADQALLAFREANKLVNLDKMTVSEQQLADINTNLSAAQNKLSEARARANQIDAMLKGGIGDGSVSDATQNLVLTKLRQQYLDAAGRVTELSQRYGPDHVSVQRARQEMATQQAAAYSELQRIAQGYHSDLDVAEANYQSVKRNYEAQMQTTASSQTLLAQARDLESSAISYRTLYQNFLQRYTQALQDESFPVPQARVFTPATPPLKKATPKAILVLGLGTVLGMGLGLAVAFVRDEFDVGLRSATDAANAAGTDCVAVLPKVKQPLRTLWALQPATLGTPAGAEPRRPSTIPPAFAESLRTILAALVARRQRQATPVVLGVTSALGGEGKTVVAANLAVMLAESRHRTILLDADLRRASLTRLLAPVGAAGWQDHVDGSAKLEDLVLVDPDSGLHVLPTERVVAVGAPDMLLGTDPMAALLAELRQHYSFIILDLPASLPYADTQLLRPHVDGMVLVAAWGTTDRRALAQCMGRRASDNDRVVGVVLNKTPAKVAKKMI